MKHPRLFPYRTYEAVLLVTSYQEGAMEGWLIHPHLDRPERIKSVPQFLFLLDGILSQNDALISYHSFDDAGLEEIEKIATIRIQVLFREHYTWQGSVLWEDEQKSASFHSVLELIWILDEILAE